MDPSGNSVDLTAIGLVRRHLRAGGPNWTFGRGADRRGGRSVPVRSSRRAIAPNQDRTVVFLSCLALALLAVPLTGGRLAALADLRLRAGGLALAAIALQFLVISVLPGAPDWVGRSGQLASYGLLAAFAWANRRVPGVLVAAAGGALNVVAIAANGGVMPASAWALRTAGIPVGHGFQNSAHLAHPHLLALGDVFALPAALPLAEVFSAGDVLLVAGAVYGIMRVCQRPAPPDAAAA
jgi:Family of unknown function (DUF5317)